VEPVPDPVILRKSGSARNRSWDLCICSQELWPLDPRLDILKTPIVTKTAYCLCMDSSLLQPVIVTVPKRQKHNRV
jgi:hypothetical protein